MNLRAMDERYHGAGRWGRLLAMRYAVRASVLREAARTALGACGPGAKVLLIVPGGSTHPKRRRLWRAGPMATSVCVCDEGVRAEIDASELLEALRHQDLVYVQAMLAQ